MADQETAHQEFPKMLYQGGEAQDLDTGRPVHHSQTRLVHDAAEEEEARAEGYLPAGGDPTPVDDGEPTPSDSEAGADFNGADAGAFDHDGDGQPGGAPKGGNRKKAA